MCMAPRRCPPFLVGILRVGVNVVTEAHKSSIGASALLIEPAADVACRMAVTGGKWIAGSR